MCEEEIKKVTASVFKYILPDTCSDAEKEEKSITAERVVEAIKYGKKVEIINAVIEGPFILKSVNVEGEVTIKNTTIRDKIDWSYATFKRVLNLKNSIFETDATFIAVTVEKDISLDGATFCGKAVFADITVMGVFHSRSTIFKKGVIFTDGTFKKRIDFSKCIFEGDAKFESARIGGNAEFTEAVFNGLSIFNSVERIFKRFPLLSTRAKFKGRANFNSAKIEGAAFFNPATFEGEADFGSARIGSTAEFTGAVFKGLASFNSAHIEGVAFFDPAIFEGEADFVSARIGSNADFARAKFKELANFTRTRIEGTAFFDPATFEGKAKFDSAQIERESHFEGTVFDNDVSFQDTSFKTVFFGEPNVKFIKNIDLRGCIYDRFQPIPFWKQLMEHLDPYDRQPFTHLEETFRRAGKDKLADDVYYERKCRESTKKFIIQNPGAWLLDRFLWLLTGYGVRLYRLLGAFVLILIIGTIIFQLEGAVTPELHSALPWSEAFWVSLNTFLPVIEIPSGADWKPSSQIIPYLGIKFTTFATFLDLAGWILVPVGVAGIAGLLKRPK